METKTDKPVAERLSEFLSRLTPAAAIKLASGLERERLRGGSILPYDLILSSLRPVLRRAAGERPGVAAPMRQFCLPFEGLLAETRDPSLHRRQILRASVQPVWSWIETDLLPDTLPDLSRRAAEHTLNGDNAALFGTLDVMHAACSSAMLQALDASRRDAAQRKKLEQQLGGEEVLDDARIMAEALAVAPHMLAMQLSLPKRIDDFDDGLAALVGEAYEEAQESSPVHAIYVPLGVIGRLEKPWQILRLARKLSGLGNEAAVARSGLAELGEIFLGELEDIARCFEVRRPGKKTDLDYMLKRVSRFAEISHGFVHEIDIRRVSEWGHRILAARARLSTAIAEEMARFEHDLARALPLHQIGSYGKTGPRRPDVTVAPNFEQAERVASALRFIAGVCPAAETIGVQSHCKTVGQQVETYLNGYEDGLIEEIRRSGGRERANATAFLDIVIGFRQALGETTMAETLRRRGKVAASQAS
ncbi:MAG TPA: hypothetical protein VF449_05975 [Parvibaculum sp.]